MSTTSTNSHRNQDFGHLSFDTNLIPDRNGDGNNHTKSNSKWKINVHRPRDNTKGIQNISTQRTTRDTKLYKLAALRITPKRYRDTRRTFFSQAKGWCLK
jgi:hypothetical protein